LGFTLIFARSEPDAAPAKEECREKKWRIDATKKYFRFVSKNIVAPEEQRHQDEESQSKEKTFAYHPEIMDELHGTRKEYFDSAIFSKNSPFVMAKSQPDATISPNCFL